MIQSKRVQYKKAYVELLELLSVIPKETLSKIPETIIINMKKEMDSEYSWTYNEEKSFDEQDVMIETKALFVQIYKKYIADETEKETWEKYDKFTKNYIEEQKNQKYDPSKLFENSTSKSEVSNSESVSPTTKTMEETSMIVYEENIFQKIINKFKEIAKRIFGK